MRVSAIKSENFFLCFIIKRMMVTAESGNDIKSIAAWHLKLSIDFYYYFSSPQYSKRRLKAHFHAQSPRHYRALLASRNCSMYTVREIQNRVVHINTFITLINFFGLFHAVKLEPCETRFYVVSHHHFAFTWYSFFILQSSFPITTPEYY